MKKFVLAVVVVALLAFAGNAEAGRRRSGEHRRVLFPRLHGVVHRHHHDVLFPRLHGLLHRRASLRCLR